MRGWAIDLGTSNTGIAHWDESGDSPRWLTLAELCRNDEQDEALRAPRLVPSATEMLPPEGLVDRLGRSRVAARHFFLGRWAWIGQPALARNVPVARPGYVSSFKTDLGRAPLRTLVRLENQPVSAREVATAFVRELLAATERTTGERIDDLVVTTPVDAYESYRVELARIFEQLGCSRVRFLDEPVAAALGYGLGIDRRRTVLVCDFGGGTLNLALVRLDARQAQRGSAEVLAKAGVALGGDNVDEWLADELCRRLNYDLSAESDRVWQGFLLTEARRVKEAIYFDGQATFLAFLPEELRRFEARLSGPVHSCEVTRDELVALLEQRGAFRAIEHCLGSVAKQCLDRGMSLDEVDGVMMVGGSTLLPGVYSMFEKRFGRERVRAWQPFEAVAYGASAYAADRLMPDDFIVHDYAFITHDAKSHEPTYTTIVPAGTRFPTRPDLWKRQLVPTCSLGAPETVFKLVVCEIGRKGSDAPRLGWDTRGHVHDLTRSKGGDDVAYVVRLNDSNPTLGFLDPPHEPDDRAPRLEISFGVDAERWLVASVLDIKTGKRLLSSEPVVRLA